MDQTKMPILEKLFDHVKEKPISFHVPGHKNGILYQSFERAIANFLKIDVTEITGLDDLHDPFEMIAEAQDLLADYYQTYKSYFLVNGSTVGNLAMILAVCEEGDQVLVQRNCHKSVLNGLMMANVRPVFISPMLDENLQTPSIIEIETIKKALERHSEIAACIFTYPDYYGQIYDLGTIIETLHQANIPVLIDEAHGPHFIYGDPFPVSALSLGADVVVHSAHKMLPAMTMGSFLHINSELVSANKIEFYLNILQSSSPSYPIMASLDYARHYLANLDQADIHYSLHKRDEFLLSLRKIPSLTVKTSPDPLKLLLRHNRLTGYKLQEVLESLHIFTELADPYQVLFTLPLLKKGMSFPYDQALERMKNHHWENFTFKNATRIRQDFLINHDTELSLSYKEMQKMAQRWVQIDKAVGKVAGKMVIPYPPGIPLLLPGEKITLQHIKQLKTLIEMGCRFQGDEDGLMEGMICIFDM